MDSRSYLVGMYRTYSLTFVVQRGDYFPLDSTVLGGCLDVAVQVVSCAVTLVIGANLFWGLWQGLVDGLPYRDLVVVFGGSKVVSIYLQENHLVFEGESASLDPMMRSVREGELY